MEVWDRQQHDWEQNWKVTQITVDLFLFLKKKERDLEGDLSLQGSKHFKEEIASVLRIEHESSGLKPHANLPLHYQLHL